MEQGDTAMASREQRSNKEKKKPKQDKNKKGAATAGAKPGQPQAMKK